MKYRRMGKTGLKISEIALGAWLTYGASVDDAVAKKCVEEAINHGINFIDIADVYAKGKAEFVIGKIMEEENYNRKDLVISSKVFWPMSDNINDRGLSRKHIMESIDNTLERLQTDYIDIYFLHRFDTNVPMKETIGAIHDLIRQGLIHYWGTSVWTAAQLEKAVCIAKELGGPPPAVEQPRYNMLDRFIELEIIDTCRRNGMGIVCWSPLAQGLLTGKYNNGIPTDTKRDQKWLKREHTEENLQKIRQLSEVAKGLHIQMSQLALAWILRHRGISAAITGATNPNHIVNNTKATEIILEPTTLEKIERILANKPEWHPIYQPVQI